MPPRLAPKANIADSSGAIHIIDDGDVVTLLDKLESSTETELPNCGKEMSNLECVVSSGKERKTLAVDKTKLLLGPKEEDGNKKTYSYRRR